MKYAIFFRGINVGGKLKINMSELKEALMNNNFNEVKTYINSGNVVFISELNKDKLKRQILELVHDKFGFHVEIIVQTAEEIKNLIKNDPFSEITNLDNSKKCIVFTSSEIENDAFDQLKENLEVIEEFYINSNVIYVYYENGQAKTKFTNNYIEKKLKTISTIRNWNTIEKVYEMIKE